MELTREDDICGPPDHAVLEPTKVGLNERMNESETSQSDLTGSTTMQLSFKTGSTMGSPPAFPVVDTIAMLLILSNLPTLLLTIAHLLFSYKQHIALSASISASYGLSLYMICFIDIMVMIFTVVILPSLRNTITDIAHIVVAISITGADTGAVLPYALAFLSTRSILSSILDRSSADLLTRISKVGLPWILSYVNRLFGTSGHSPDDRRGMHATGLQYTRSAIALHIISLGVLKLLVNSAKPLTSTNAITEESKEQVSHNSQKLRRRSLDGNAKTVLDTSIWDALLQLRADSTSRRHEVAQYQTQHTLRHVCLSEISARRVGFVLEQDGHDEPEIEVRINGLLWNSKITCVTAHPLDVRNEYEAYLHVLVDSLSAKTEYDFTINVTAHSHSVQYAFTICTAACTTATRKIRTDIRILPSQFPNVIDEHLSFTDLQPHDMDVLSPDITSEECIKNASNRLEERRSLLRRTRKENTKRVQHLQREVEHLASRLFGIADKNDQRIQGRMLSLQTEIKRAQDHIDDMESDKNQTIQWLEAQAILWVEERHKRDHMAQMLEGVRQRYDLEKAEHQKRLSSVANDASRTRMKADKLSFKRTKIQQELDRISLEQDEILQKEFFERNSAREFIKNQRLQTEAEYLKIIHDFQQRVEFLDVYGAA